MTGDSTTLRVPRGSVYRLRRIDGPHFERAESDGDRMAAVARHIRRCPNIRGKLGARGKVDPGPTDADADADSDGDSDGGDGGVLETIGQRLKTKTVKVNPDVADRMRQYTHKDSTIPNGIAHGVEHVAKCDGTDTPIGVPMDRVGDDPFGRDVERGGGGRLPPRDRRRSRRRRRP